MAKLTGEAGSDSLTGSAGSDSVDGDYAPLGGADNDQISDNQGSNLLDTGWATTF
jgi:hypothetical protein